MSYSKKRRSGPKKFRSVFLAAKELTTYREAANETMWLEAMEKELEAIEKNKTCTLTYCPHTSLSV